jgi:hypothetical protein
MKPYLKLLAPMLAVMLLGGCATSAGSSEQEAPAAGVSEAEAPLPPPPQDPQSLNSVDLLDVPLHRTVKVTKNAYRKTAGNTTQVLVTFENLLEKPQTLKVRTQWFTEDRVHQEGPTEWTLVHLPARGMETYTAHSKGRNAEGYYVEVLEK